MKYLYGEFTRSQFGSLKKKLHNKLFWLLLYKDPNTQGKYAHVDFNNYFINLMAEIDGLNELLFFPDAIVEMCMKLQAAYHEAQKSDFDYRIYRKLVLDAHKLVDDIFKGDEI
jgi:hypothetical protein